MCVQTRQAYYLYMRLWDLAGGLIDSNYGGVLHKCLPTPCRQENSAAFFKDRTPSTPHTICIAL